MKSHVPGPTLSSCLSNWFGPMAWTGGDTAAGSCWPLELEIGCGGGPIACDILRVEVLFEASPWGDGGTELRSGAMANCQVQLCFCAYLFNSHTFWSSWRHRVR